MVLLTRILSAPLLAAYCAHGSIIPTIDTRRPDEVLRFDRVVELEKAELRVRVTPERNMIPRASVELQHAVNDAVRLTYISQVGLGGMPSLSDTEALGVFSPTVWNSSNVNLAWRYGWRWSGRIHTQVRTESRDSDLFYTQVLGSGAEVSRPIGPYSVRLGATTENRYENDREMYSRQRLGLGVSRSLKDFPLGISVEPSLQRETVVWRPHEPYFTPRIDATLSGRLEENLSWQAGGSYQEQLNGALAPLSNALRYFTRLDWKLSSDVKIRTDAEYSGSELVRPGTGTYTSEQLRVRLNPRMRINELFDANLDLLQKFDSTGTRGWEPGETRVYFSLSGRF